MTQRLVDSYTSNMAAVFFLLVATLAVGACLLAGIILLAFPTFRSFAPYLLLVYPSAYAAAAVDMLVARRLFTAFVDFRSQPQWLGSFEVLVAFAALLTSTLIGGLVGFAMANRLWWRFFTDTTRGSAFPDCHGLLALTPPIREGLQTLSTTLRSFKHKQG
jgi:hypothetical protein